MRVLIVDDDPDIRQIADLGLSRIAEWNVTSVASGSEAIERCREQEFDLVLLDIMMPDMDGPATLGALRRIPNQHFQVIFLTAKVEKRWIDLTLALGARGFIPKPFDPGTLADEIRRILGL